MAKIILLKVDGVYSTRTEPMLVLMLADIYETSNPRCWCNFENQLWGRLDKTFETFLEFPDSKAFLDNGSISLEFGCRGRDYYCSVLSK